MLGRYAVYVVNLLSMMILARIFTPEIFGTVAAIMVFFVFFQLMAEAGLGPAIINLQQMDAEDRDGLFGLTIIIGLLLAILFAALGPLFLMFYQLPRVDEVVPYIAISLLFFSTCIVPNALLLREQAFFSIANGGLLAETLSTAATIILAQLIDPLHALAAKGAFSAATQFLVIWYFSGKTEIGRPLPGRKFSAIKPLLGFSSYQHGFNFINYFSRNLDNILVGKYMGASALGVYDKAYQLMRYPLLLLTFAMTPAIQPVLRKYAGDYHKVEEIHQDFTFKLSLLGVIAGFLVYILADLMVSILLGSNWSEVIPIIKILAISIPVQVVLSTSGSFYQAMNKADLLFHCGIFSSIVVTISVLIGIFLKNIEILCWGLVAAFHLSFVQAYYYMYKKVFFSQVRRFFIRMLPMFSYAFAMVAWSINY
ncbi:oligosaccharide flippase family protein [Azonexus hydrophilus]|uniref:Oligosaccharide flippase family protein n=1 Tax=Azonexus hydrophilus TaxID=418702 RepID=A0ABZ2XF46_9RHOO